MPRSRFRPLAMAQSWAVVPGMHGPTVNIVCWYPRWFPITASNYSYVDVCVLGRYYTYLDIWVERVISTNIKNSNDSVIQTSSLSFYIFIACLLYMYTRYSFDAYYCFGYINTHILISARHLAFT